MDSQASGDERSDGARRWLSRLATVTAVAPCLLAVVRALATGWHATSDNAFIAIRALDVLTLDHHPLAGTWSSVSASAETTIFHPGPLLFDTLAIPSRVLGTDIGVPLVMGCLNAACAWWTISLIGRIGGLSARLVAAVVVALLTWTMAWPRLIEPLNPHAAMMPALLLFVACGVLTLGEPSAALPAVVGGSLAVQIHIGHVYIVGFLLLVTLGLWWLNGRLDAARRARWSRRQRLAPLAVLVALWLQPIIDLVVNGGNSNAWTLLTEAGSATGLLGPTRALALVAAVVAVPPWWLPDGFAAVSVLDPVPSMATSVVSLAVVIALLVTVGWRGPTRLARAFGRYVALLIPLSIVSVARVPLNPFVGYSSNQWRWLWIVGALVTLVAGWVIVALVLRSPWRPAPAVLVATAATACLAAVALNVTVGRREVPVEQEEAGPIGEFVDALPYEELASCGRVVVAYEAGFAAPALVAPAVLLALRERDIELAPLASDAQLQIDRRPGTGDACVLTLAEQPGDGRLVGSLDGRLALSATLTGPG